MMSEHFINRRQVRQWLSVEGIRPCMYTGMLQLSEIADSALTNGETRKRQKQR
jgi:hypothetical protein